MTVAPYWSCCQAVNVFCAKARDKIFRAESGNVMTFIYYNHSVFVSSRLYSVRIVFCQGFYYCNVDDSCGLVLS